MPASDDSRSRSGYALVPHRWRSAHVLEAVCEVNEHFVSALTELARNANTSMDIVRQNAEALRRLNLDGCKRAARIPLLLLDLHFQNVDWWRNAIQFNGGVSPTTTGASKMPVDLASELTRETLIVAWLAVRETPQSANLLFGMSDAVASLLVGLSARQLSRIAAERSHELGIRWQGNLEFWQRLLAAGQSGSVEDLCETHLLGLQLLGGDLMTTR